MTLISLRNALTRDPFRMDDYRIRVTLGRTKATSSVKTHRLAIREDDAERPAPPRRLLPPRNARVSRSR